MSLPPSLPQPSPKRIALRVTPDARRHIAAGHPWVYDESITSLSHRGAPGDLAVVFDNERKFVAIGLNDPASPIRLKILHRGKPVQIDRAFWQARLDAALAIRAPLAASGDTTGFRCIHGENDHFPGLVLDRYADTLVLKLYSAAWIPHLAAILPVIVDTLHPKAVVLRLSRAVQSDQLHGLSEGMALYGETPDSPVPFMENGLHFEADVVHGQKTGHFLDQRENRALLGSMATGARVLDMFSATGGFSVYAAAGGASSVTSVDLSAPTLAVAERNFAHNKRNVNVQRCAHKSIVGDAFEVMDRLVRNKERYDIVVIDPPSFAQRQSSVERALQAYGQLTDRAVRLTREDGLLVQASCSSRVTADEFYATIRGSAGRSGYDLSEVRSTGHPLDHPIGFTQGAYLKALFARVHRL
jgi:23S rRNA (cytosine1962-C5)-methyltransferase